MADNHAEGHLKECAAANPDTDCTSRLPVEVLSSIFQVIVEEIRDEYSMKSRADLRMTRWFEEDGFRMETPGFTAATVLSHVCSRWRLIAIDTANLWTDFTLSLTWDGSTFDHFCSTIFPRVKSAPCRPVIEDVDLSTPPIHEQTSTLPHVGSNAGILPLYSCILPSMMVISQLHVIFSRPPGECDHPVFLDFLSSIHGGVTGIKIDGRHTDGIQRDLEIARSRAPLRLRALTDVLPHLRRVEIRRLLLKSLLVDESCAALEELVLDVPTCTLDLTDVLAKLPNLVKLSLVGFDLDLVDNPTSFNEANPIYPSIRELNVIAVAMLGWDTLGQYGPPKHFPFLESLALSRSSTANGQVEEFFERHPTIRRLAVRGVEYASVEEYLLLLRRTDEEAVVQM